MNISSIKETCIYMEDLEAARRFYHNVLGLPVIGEVRGKHIFFRAGTSVLLCFNPQDSREKKSPPGHYASGKQHFAFEVPASDYESAKKEIASHDITITDEVTWHNGERSFYFEDPAGNVVEILPEGGIWK